jgi:hypothetical protein
MKNLHLLIALILLLIGCAPHVQVEVGNPTATLTPATIVPAATSTQVNAPTAIPTLPPTATVTIPAFEEKCVNSVKKFSGGRLDGTMVFVDSKTLSLILLRGGTRTRIPEQPGPDNRIGWSAVSPGGKYLMYQDPFGELIVRKPDLSKYAQFDEINDIYGINSLPLRTFQWLGDDIAQFSMTVGRNETLVVRGLNIHSGDLWEMNRDFPDMARRAQTAWDIDGTIIHKRYQGGDFLYDPTLKRVLYPKKDGMVVLYDTEKNVELASVQLKDGGLSPTWSPDGHFVVITSRSGLNQGELGDEFFITSRDGPSFRQLTSIGNTHAGDSIGSYSWSPDSSHIAFWMKSPDKEEYSLAVTDVTSGAITNYCITGLAKSFSVNLTPDSVSPTLLGVSTGKPVWSPDGTKLLISQWEAEKKSISVILVDLPQQTAYPFQKDLEPIGWMNSLP